MEVLIIVLFALLAIVVLEAGYGIALSLMRWAPVIAAGAMLGWTTGILGAAPLEALGLGVLACLLTRHVLRRRRRPEYHDEVY